MLQALSCCPHICSRLPGIMHSAHVVPLWHVIMRSVELISTTACAVEPSLPTRSSDIARDATTGDTSRIISTCFRLQIWSIIDDCCNYCNQRQVSTPERASLALLCRLLACGDASALWAQGGGLLSAKHCCCAVSERLDYGPVSMGCRHAAAAWPCRGTLVLEHECCNDGCTSLLDPLQPCQAFERCNLCI